MNRILSAMLAVRERAGGRNEDRMAFQAAVSVAKLIECFQAGRTFRALFDHIDDLLLHDREDDPSIVHIFQIKGWDTKKCTIAALVGADEDGALPRTIPGRLYWGLLNFGAQGVGELGFLTNASLDIKLANGKKTGGDRQRVFGTEMHDAEWDRIQKAIANDHPNEAEHECRSRFMVERVEIPVRAHREVIIFRLFKVMEQLGAIPDVSPMMGTATALLAEVRGKIGVTREFSDIIDLYREKSITASEFGRFLRRAIDAPNFQQAWPMVEARLRERLYRDSEILEMRLACLAYLRAHINGEAAAAEFRQKARAKLRVHADRYWLCSTILEQAGLIDPIEYGLSPAVSVPFAGNTATQAARIVEAYEAPTWLKQIPADSSGSFGT